MIRQIWEYFYTESRHRCLLRVRVVRVKRGKPHVEWQVHLHGDPTVDHSLGGLGLNVLFVT